jgi:hypothetical protein
MSKYQDEIYEYFAQLEDSISKKSKNSQTYMSYTRQSCNFVFPAMGQGITGESRPRPRNFKLADRIDKGNLEMEDEKKEKDDKYYDVTDYLNQVDKFVISFDSYLTSRMHSDKDKKYTIADDIQKIREKYNYNVSEFYEKEKQKSELFEALYACSAKFLTVIINILRSAGPVLVYSNYVLMEGLQIFKMYLKYFGFTSFKDMNSGTSGFRYIEYHGGIDKEQRFKNVEQYNVIENKNGNVIKINTIFQIWSKYHKNDIYDIKDYTNEKMKIYSMSDGGTISTTRNKCMIGKCDIYMPSTCFGKENMKCYNNFEDLPGKKGYGIVFNTDKQNMVNKMLNIEWDKIAFLSTNSAYNLRSSQIYSLFNF